MVHSNDNIPAEQAKLTGKILALAVAADFEDFFLPHEKMKIPITVEAANNPCVRGKGDDTRIVITPDMAADHINDADRFFFHLLIIGHEIAHLVHRHLHATDMEQADDSALEYWADFYGAKVLMTLITFGDQCSKICRSYFGEAAFEKPLESIGRAVRQMIEFGYYNEHPRYPKPLLRVALVSNGVTSFLRHEMESPPEIWYFSVFKRIFCSNAARDLMLLHPEHVDLDLEPIRLACDWHKTMQGDDTAITGGFKLNLIKHLHTTFDQTAEDQTASQRLRLEELKTSGYLLDEKLDDLN